MQRNTFSPPLDAGIPAACALLFGIGLTAIYSMSLSEGTDWPVNHLISAGIAVCAAAAIFQCPLHLLRRFTPLIMTAVLVALALVFAFSSSGGAHRWLRIGGLSLQPSELCKWAVLLMAAHYASRPLYKRRQVAFVMPVAYWLCPVLFLLILQSDYGTLLLVVVSVLAILFIAGLDLRLTGGLTLLFAGTSALLILFAPYRMQRLASFVDPFVAAGGYHQKQALIAFVQGGIWGKGAERSVLKWEFLPQAHTDFIAAIIGEEMGLVGLLGVCALFAVVAGRAIKIGNAAAARDEIFGALFAFGCAIMLSAQAFIHLGGNLALLPSKGLTLPLVSYGGSSLLATGLMLGVLMRVDYENRMDGARGI